MEIQWVSRGNEMKWDTKSGFSPYIYIYITFNYSYIYLNFYLYLYVHLYVHLYVCIDLLIYSIYVCVSLHVYIYMHVYWRLTPKIIDFHKQKEGVPMFSTWLWKRQQHRIPKQRERKCQAWTMLWTYGEWWDMDGYGSVSWWGGTESRALTIYKIQPVVDEKSGFLTRAESIHICISCLEMPWGPMILA